MPNPDKLQPFSYQVIAKCQLTLSMTQLFATEDTLESILYGASPSPRREREKERQFWVRKYKQGRRDSVCVNSEKNNAFLSYVRDDPFELKFSMPNLDKYNLIWSCWRCRSQCSGPNAYFSLAVRSHHTHGAYRTQSNQLSWMQQVNLEWSCVQNPYPFSRSIATISACFGGNHKVKVC